MTQPHTTPAMQGPARPRLAVVASSALVALALSACNAKPEAPAAGAAGSSAAVVASASAPSGTSGTNAPRGPAPVSITTVQAERRELSSVVEATGSIVPRRTVDVRSQINGTLRDVLVREGETVRQGQLLFRLDDRNERAQLERVKAQLARDEATLADNQRQLARSQALLAQNFLSQGAVDAAATAVQAQAAAVAASKAAVSAAEVALSLMTISAPLPGRLGAIAVHPGAFVAVGATPLVTISEMQPVMLSFAVPQRYLPQLLSLQRSRAAAVEVAAPDGAAKASKPSRVPISFIDNTVDPATGTVRIKAELANADGQWWPGAFARVRVQLQTTTDATVVPVAAIVQGARGRTVFIVDDQGQAQAKPVDVIESADGMAAVRGIEPGAKVVMDGRHNLRPGTPVVERAAGAGKAASRP